MTRKRWHVGCLVALQLVCAPLALAQQSTDQWQEEILLQLSELRKSQGELAKQVADLTAVVQALRAGTAAAEALSLDLRNSDFPVLGDAKAGIAIVEFSDFECPYCLRHYRDTVPALTSKYIDSGKVRYVFVDFPLSFHANAQPAALAGACAHRQGAFWKMRDLLFDNQRSLGQKTFTKLAADLHLNAGEFSSCMQDPKLLAQIRGQAQLGDSVGVQGTPAFLIGRVKDGKLVDGRLVSGAQPLANFERVIDPLLSGG